MEALVVIAVCIVIWKLLDSNKSKQEVRHMATRTTVVTDRNGVRETQATTIERFETSDFQSRTATAPDAEYPQSPSAHHRRRVERDVTPQVEKRVDPVVNMSRYYQRQAAAKAIPDQNRMKSCPKCGALKSVSEFRQNSKAEDGLTKWCSHCLNNQGREKKSQYKTCPNCGKNRKTTSFYSSSKRLDGLTKWCKYCLRK
ncbi:MAG: hypothetical protein K6L60_05470 [Oceanobacter sp.]